jgi:hypothetical protein
MAVQFDASSAQRMLKDANTHFAAMLPAVDGLQGQADGKVPMQGDPAHAASSLPPCNKSLLAAFAAVTGHAQSYVAAVQALQQQLAAFAAPTPVTHRAALEAQVSALEQELSRAVRALLHRLY